MKTKLSKLVAVAGCAAGIMMLAGCTSAPPAVTDSQNGTMASLDETQAGYDTFGRKWGQAPAPAPAPMAAPAMPAGGSVYGYFPSGRPEGSGLLLIKSAPAQVLAGQAYQYTYEVTNLTDATLENVIVSDRVSGDFTATDADPAATSTTSGNATWNLGTFAPKQGKMITVKGSSPDEGVVTTCGTATYNPVICQDIHVVKAGIQLTKTEPSDVSVCDVVPVTLTVKNSGSSELTGVQIADNLPGGMTVDGKSALTFDAGNLAPGESKDFKYNAAVSATGALVNTAKATSAEGVSADATATTTVHQPVLAVTCKATDQQFIGRKFDVSYTVSNTGDSPSAGNRLEVSVPAGLTVVSAGNGQATADKIDWDLGSIDASSPQTVTATFMSAVAGTFDFAGAVKGACGAPASTSCETKVVGIPAILLEKSDDPDPVAIGDTTTYTVKVTNQGSAADHNVAVIVTVDGELVPVSTTDGTIDGQVVTLPTVPSLEAKQAVTYKIIAKGVTAGDAHTKFSLSSDMLTSPITAEESTHVY